jgi:hypothetical protein
MCKIYRYYDIEFCELNDVPFIDLQTCCDNTLLPQRSSTGVKGVRIKNGKYEVNVCRNNKTYYAGKFSTIEEAKVAYNKKLAEIEQLIK